MTKVYGSTSLFSDGGDHSSPWCQRWKAIARLNGKHYILPGSLVSCHFINMVPVELNHLSLCHYLAKCCLIFGSAILQRDRMIKKGSDVHCLLEKHHNLWQEDKFDFIV